MEDVLDVYHRPFDPKRPLVCLDECNKQLVSETRDPLPAEPGRPERVDYEYVRHGVASYFMLLAPLQGWREVVVTGTKTKLDYAHTLQQLSDVHFKDAEKIVLVQDKSEHPRTQFALRRLRSRGGSPFAPALRDPLHTQARQLAEHGRVRTLRPHISRQCLNRRIGSADILRREIAAWVAERNQVAKTYKWRFTTAAARIKLLRFYPSIQQ